jgi:hypothetical protein
VKVLKIVGFTDAQLSQATGMSESAVAKWRASTEPNPAAWRALDELRVVTNYLIRHGTAPEGAHAWLVARHVDLDMKTALHYISVGAFESRVLPLAKRFCPAEPLSEEVALGEVQREVANTRGA